MRTRDLPAVPLCIVIQPHRRSSTAARPAAGHRKEQAMILIGRLVIIIAALMVLAVPRIRRMLLVPGVRCRAGPPAHRTQER
jgi:hypothetical protein